MASISALSIEIQQKSNCLFGFVQDSKCAYSMLEPQIFLGLGGALTALGLLFAAYEFANNSALSIKLELRSNLERFFFLWLFPSLGILFALVAALVTQIPFEHIQPPFNNALFYEILSFISFIIGIVLIGFVTRRIKTFSEKNSRIFYEILIKHVSKNDKSFRNAVLEILSKNLRKISNILVNSSEPEARGNARAVLDVILSEHEIAETIATERLDILFHVLNTFEEERVTNRHVGYGFQQIMHQLFFNKKSFLHKQLNKEGLALSSNVAEKIFKNSYFLNNFDLFSYEIIKYQHRSNLSPDTIEIFTRNISMAIKNYHSGVDIEVKKINYGILMLSEMMDTAISEISLEEESSYEKITPVRSLANFFGKSPLYLIKPEIFSAGVIDRELDTRTANLRSSRNLNEAFSQAMYRTFLQLGNIKNLDNFEYYLLTLGLFESIKDESQRIPGYKKPFEKKIWNQIARNVLKKVYPNITKPYLLFGGYLAANNLGTGDDWFAIQAEKIRQLLYVDLKPLFVKDLKMVNGKSMEEILLPASIIYNKEQGSFFRRQGILDTDLIEIPRPRTETSAFHDISVENIKEYDFD